MSNSSRQTRRGFVRAGLAASTLAPIAFTQQTGPRAGSGDLAILRFALANELIAADLWGQMADQIASNASLAEAFRSIDPLLPRILMEIARNERSHAEFLTAYWLTTGSARFELDRFRTLPAASPVGASLCADTGAGAGAGSGSGSGSGTATGTGTSTGAAGFGASANPSSGLCVPRDTGAAPGVGIPAATGRLVNLSSVNIDTSWYQITHTSESIDFGRTFPAAQSAFSLRGVPLAAPAGSGTGTGTGGSGTGTGTGSGTGATTAATPQQLAQAALLFASMMEYMETTTYLALAPKISSIEIMSVLGSMMPIEMAHHTALQIPLSRLLTMVSGGSTGTGTGTGTGSGGTGTGTGAGGSGFFGITFPQVQDIFATSILPAPSRALPGLPYVSHVRPRMQPSAGAVQAVRQMMAANLFQGQPAAFTDLMMQVAAEADAAMRAASTTTTPTTEG